MMSTMCVCGDMVQVADISADNLHVPHADPKTGEPCPGLPLTAGEKFRAAAIAAGVVRMFVPGLASVMREAIRAEQLLARAKIAGADAVE